ncbi:MAG: DNA-directed RNA polymerase subunit omega [Candidatus Zhuqueibacterota bacterium]|jgi:DNA-directed RNA polymerase subunit K/omega
MTSTIDLDVLLKYSDNLYEAIIVIAKRAKQINDEQKRFIEQETGVDDSMDNYDDDEDLDPQIEEEPKIIKLPKPTEVAIMEMLGGKINYDYGMTEAEAKDEK